MSIAKPPSARPLPPEALHLIAADAPSAQGRCVAPGEPAAVLHLDLDDGRKLFVHLGAESVRRLQASGVRIEGPPLETCPACGYRRGWQIALPLETAGARVSDAEAAG